MNIEWPRRPDGSEVPVHRRSIMAFQEGYPIFCASDWKVKDGKTSWMCGYCEKITSDPLSTDGTGTLADCRHCGKTNRVSL